MILCVGDDKPITQLSENLEDRASVVSHVFFVEGLDVLLVDVQDDHIDAHLVNDLLVDVVIPNIKMLIMEFD